MKPKPVVPRKITRKSQKRKRESSDKTERTQILRRKKTPLGSYVESESESKSDSGSDFLPDSYDKESDMSDKSSEEIASSLSNTPSPKKKKRYSYETAEAVPVTEDFLNKLYVPDSSDGDKYGSKKNFCPYCKVTRARLDRHLIRKHADKNTVDKIKTCDKQTPERRKLFKDIRIAGHAIYNVNPEYNTDGKLLVTRRLRIKKNKESSDEEGGSMDLYGKIRNCKLPNERKDESEKPLRLPRTKCKECSEYVATRTLSVHMNKFHPKSKKQSFALPTRDILKSARQQSDLFHPAACKITRKYILPSMKQDEVYNAIEHDVLILTLAKNDCDHYDKTGQHKLIISRLRTIARFVIKMREINRNYTNLESCLRASNFEYIIKAVRLVAS